MTPHGREHPVPAATRSVMVPDCQISETVLDFGELYVAFFPELPPIVVVRTLSPDARHPWETL